MKTFFLFLLLAVTTFSFGQRSKYWIRFKDKNHNTYSLSNPGQFLSQKSLDRRTKQGISLNESDLPLSETYIDSISPYITNLVHRVKWFNLVVVDMETAITSRSDTFTTAWRDTVIQPDTFSISVFDTVIYYQNVHLDGISFSYDTTRAHVNHVVHDTFIHPGPVYYRDTIVFTQVITITGNNFDSIRQLACVDTMAEIKCNPTKSTVRRNKNEDPYPFDQLISYPSKYGAAYHQINMLNADLVHQHGNRGEGITIAMMDNGYYRADQIAAYDSVRSRIMGTWDFVHNEPNVYNDGSHGEMTFSCIAANLPYKFIGTAPDANFYLFVTEDDGGEWIMEEYNWAAAAIVADSLGAQVFSTSLGYTEFDGHQGDHIYPQMDGHTTVITNAGNMAFSKGILVVNSAGNEGTAAWHYIAAPADGDDVMAIGAVDSSREMANFSSRGPAYGGRVKPDVCAQGRESTVVDPTGYLAKNDGTSFSCPITAGCAASLWSAFPDKSAREIRDAIVSSADHYLAPNDSFGYGIPNFYNAYQNLQTNYNTNVLRISDEALVYPNPFTNELNISFYNEDGRSHKVELFDLQGRRVYGVDFFLRDKTFEIMKPGVVPGLQEGEYILRLDGKKDLTHRLIKMR